jgi:Flp pilus assembly protein, secretin CpaC
MVIHQEVSEVKKIIIALLLIATPLLAHAIDEITMFIGEIKIIEVGAIDRVAVGNAGLVSTSMLDNGQLLLLAEKEGETTVHIWYTDGAESDVKVQILPKDNARVVEEIRALLGDLRDVEVKQIGERIFLTGSVLTTDEPLMSTIKTAYPQLIDMTRKYEPPASALILPSQKMIYMNVKITEFNTNKLTELGINWADFVNGPSAGVIVEGVRNSQFNVRSDPNLLPNISALAGIPTRIGTPLGYFGLAAEITSRINLLVQTGDAVILAEPKLSTRSGGKAEFLAGGEIPVVTTGALGTTNVEYKEFGIKLNIEPVVDSQDNIMAHVSTEISAVNQATPIGSGEPPAFIKRTTSTDISMKDKETLVISGLMNRDLGNSVDKFPVLGDVPILGALFRSTRWNNNLTELVIFVTPTVYDAKSEFNQEKVESRDKMIEQFRNNVKRDDLILD